MSWNTMPQSYAAEWWYTGDRVEPDCNCPVTWPREQTDGQRYWAICPKCGDVFEATATRAHNGGRS